MAARIRREEERVHLAGDREFDYQVIMRSGLCRLDRRSFLLGGAAAAIARPSSAAEPVPFRISTENLADHVQTRLIARFATVLAERSAGRLAVSHGFGTEMYRDRDVVRALNQGAIEMAVPGTWQLDGTCPGVGVFGLPAFYGRERPVHDAVRDGPVGAEISRRLEGATGTLVLGRWIDLGFSNVYGVRRTIATHADLKGLRVRVPGGEANLYRLAALGAQGKVVAWKDLPQALAEGTVDAIISTHETVVSNKLWTQGLTSVFEDHQYFAQYVPLVSRHLRARLSSGLYDLIAGTWEEMVDGFRAEAEAAQRSARDRLAAEKMMVTHPSAEVLAEQRRALMVVQPAMVTAMGIDDDLVARAMASLGQR
jgi:C4-dicarboxylate-binding protein DctP